MKKNYKLNTLYPMINLLISSMNCSLFFRTSMIPLIVHLPNTRSPPIAARAAPAWLNGSIFLVAVFGVVLGLLGVVILVLILYIYKQ